MGKHLALPLEKKKVNYLYESSLVFTPLEKRGEKKPGLTCCSTYET
jgi:hypothetical protein